MEELERLRRARMDDGDSHGNLSRICKAVYPVAGGWTKESCEGLRDRLIDLIGGRPTEAEEFARRLEGAVAEGEDVTLFGVDYTPRPQHCDEDGPRGGRPADGLEAERSAVADRIAAIDAQSGGFVKALAGAVGVEWRSQRVMKSMGLIKERLIRLLGGTANAGAAYDPYALIDSLRRANERDADVIYNLNGQLEDMTAERDELRAKLDHAKLMIGDIERYIAGMTTVIGRLREVSDGRRDS